MIIEAKKENGAEISVFLIKNNIVRGQRMVQAMTDRKEAEHRVKTGRNGP